MDNEHNLGINGKTISFKEQRIRGITNLYYSRPEIQKAIFNFSKNREISPRYFEGFGKRPDSLQYKRDIFELVKKGATSLHCSEELWDEPLNIFTGMSEEQANDLRIGWDFIIDIDSKYIDYSKIMAVQIIKFLNFHKVKNIGIKFSGSKGFHLIIPWKAFPKKIGEKQTKDMFPEWPKIVLNYISEKIKPFLINEITKLTISNKYVKDFEAPKEVMPDLILMSSRHLFRMPYSLHEKTALASIVLEPTPEMILNFQLKDADPLKLSAKNVKDFTPPSEEGEAKELLVQALDWNRENIPEEKEFSGTNFQKKNFQPVRIEQLSDKNFPPCVKNILKGISDGKKRAIFVLINLFRSVGLEREEVERRIYEWNKKNNPALLGGYIKSQINWSFRNSRGSIMPPNCKEFYQGIAVCQPDDFCKKIKNPVSYVTRKSFYENNENKKSKAKKKNNKKSKENIKNKKDNFKNNN